MSAVTGAREHRAPPEPGHSHPRRTQFEFTLKWLQPQRQTSGHRSQESVAVTGASDAAGPREGQSLGTSWGQDGPAEQALKPSRTWARARRLDLRAWNITVLRPQAQSPPEGCGRRGASSWEHSCSSSPRGYGRTRPRVPSALCLEPPGPVMAALPWHLRHSRSVLGSGAMCPPLTPVVLSGAGGALWHFLERLSLARGPTTSR